MRKTTFLLPLLLMLLGVMEANAQAYRPKTQATALKTDGTKYFLANTADTDRRYFIYDNQANTPGATAFAVPIQFVTADVKYIWTLEASGTADVYYLKTSNNTYAGIHGVTTNTSPVDLTIKNWANSDHKASNQSTAIDGTMMSQTNGSYGDDYDQKVWTIQNPDAYDDTAHKGCWNGNNQNAGWAEWSQAHPYAFYELEEVRTAAEVAAYESALEKASGLFYKLQDLYGLAASANQYSTNAPEKTGEGPIENLLDGDYSTYFHSSWSQAVGDYHYLQAELTEPVKSIYFYFKKRSDNNNNRPTEMEIQGSNDGTTFTSIQTINTGFPTQATTLDYISPEITFGDDVSYKYLRFVVKNTSNGACHANDSGHPYFTFSEFYIYPVNDVVKQGISTIDAIRSLDYVADDFTEVVESVSTFETELENLAMTVTFNYVYDGYTFHTSTTNVLKGKSYTFTSDYSRVGLTCTNDNIVSGEITDTNNTFTYNYELNADELPFSLFVFGEDGEFPADVTWYSVKLREKYSYYDAAANRVKCVGTRDYLLNKHLFAFAGDPARGFHIYNKVSGADKILGGTSTVSMMDKNSEGAGSFILEHNEGHYVFRKDGTELGYLNDLSNAGTYGYWQSTSAKTDAGSTFLFEDVTSLLSEIPMNEAKSAVADAIAEANQYTGTGDDLRIGDGYNLYQSEVVKTVDDLTACVTEAAGALEATDASIESLTEAATKLQAVVDGLSLKRPSAKSFLRIRATMASQAAMPYLTSENSTAASHSTRGAYSTVRDEKTIFYFDENKLVGYSAGYYLKNNSNFAGYATAAADNNATVVDFQPAGDGTVGAYNVSFNNGTRWLYTKSETQPGTDETDEVTIYYTDAGSGNNGVGYNYWLEEVTELPVKITNAKKFATFWTPVALTVPAGVEVYTVELNAEDNVVVLEQMESGATLPAGTGVLLHGEVGTYNFPIQEGSTAPAVGSLQGQTYLGTFTYDADNATTYTLQTLESGNMGFRLYNGSTVPAFKAYLDVAGTGVSATTLSLIFAGDETTGISGATAEGSGSAPVIYDLGGRRVTAPKKGLYIVNGTKVLIK